MTDGKEVKYKAVCDYGRRSKRDKKTGEIMMKQVKTELTFKTLKEAREARAEAVLIRSAGAYAREASSKKFCDVVEDYKRSGRYKSFSGSYQDHMENYMNHMVDFFKDTEADKISVVDMEAYYAYQLESGSLNTAKGDKGGEACKKGGITVNTLPKHKTAAKHLWEFMVDAKAYGVVENVAEKSRIPKAVIYIDGKKKNVSKVPFHARPLSLDELNYTLNDAIQNEFDRSIAVMAALAAVGSLRHSETVGLKLGKFMHDGLMAVTDSALDYGGFDREYYEKHDSLMLIDTAVMYINSKNVEKLPKGDKVRVAAVPECLKKIIAYAMEQRQEVYGIVGREIGSAENVYMPLINIIEGRPLVSQKLSRKWEEYQKRRNKRMAEAGLEPIPPVRYHDLRHTHATLLKENVPQSQISYNMGHSVINPGMDNTTTRVYWNDRQPIRGDIIRFFDGNIKLDWDRALRKSINSGSKISVNGSGHLVFSEEERESRKKQGKKCIYKEQELEQMFGE